MYRLVFFGLPGGFSTIPLEALARAGYPPVLVVQGKERIPGALRPTVQRLSARRGLLARVQDRLRGETAPPPIEATGPDLVGLASRLGVEVLETSHANDPAVQQALADARPDAYVVAGFSHLLSAKTLSIPARGGLNLHPGALPEERGPAPLFWALKEGRSRLTWTIHVLDAGEDSGDVVTSGEVDVTPGDDGQAMLRTLATAAAPAMTRAVRALMAGDLVRMPQPDRPVERRRRPRFSDGRIDPNRTAVEVYTFAAGCARAYSLFVEVAQDRFFIRRAVGYDPDARPDFEWFLTGDRLLLRCRPGMVELELKEGGALFSAEYDDPDEDEDPPPLPPRDSGRGHAGQAG